MEDSVDQMKAFLREFKEHVQSPTEEYLLFKNVGNYQIYPEDFTGQIIDWVVNYMENKKCPHALALAVAQRTLQQIGASFFKQIDFDDEDTEKFPSAANLYAEAIAQLPLACSALLAETNFEEFLNTVCPSPYTISVFATKNKRRKMEDKHVIYPNLNSVLNIKDAPLHSYYAVFDGHSGIEAANFVSAQLHVNIAKHPCFLIDPVTAIREAYQITDESFLKRCVKENIKSGCTVLSALIRENTVYVSWLGDSQAILVKQGKSTTITNSHKPDREDERQRIENLGGHITFSGVLRVNGVLAVTRAIGDPDHKPFISSEPEISVFSLDGSEDFLILACDGLWDGMSSEDVTTSLYHIIMDAPSAETLDTIAAKLVHQSKLQGSEDNITAVVIFLRDLDAIKEDAKKFYRNLSQVNMLEREIFSENGQAYEIISNSINGSDALVKPNILELNATSSKKLKNTANVLSSTGLGSSCYQYSENDSNMIFENLNAEHVTIETTDGACGISIPQKNSAFFAPETTALSELPTPPIDDILAAQQFENFSRKQQEINSGIQQSEFPNFQDEKPVIDFNTNKRESGSSGTPSQFHNFGEFDLLGTSEIEGNVIQNNINILNVSPDDLNTHLETITPDEAVGIASCVVTSAIESAVKRLSSPEMLQENTTQSQENTIQSPVKLNPYAEPFVMKYYVEEPFCKSSIQEENKIDQDLSLDANHVVDLQISNNKIVSEIINVEEVNSSDEQQNIIVENEKNIAEIEKAESLLYESPQIGASSTVLDHSIFNLQLSENDTEITTSSKKLDNNSAIFDKDTSEVKFEAEANKFLDYTIDDLSLDIKNKVVSSNSSELHVEEITKSFQNLDKEVPANLKELECEKETKYNEHDTRCSDELSKITSEESIQNTLPISEPASKNVPMFEKCGISSISDLKREPEMSNASLLLKNEKNDSVELVNIQSSLNATGAILSSSHVSELPIETVAVDLQSVPVGVPEAEGVTEDIDSDSEKDGGWSYMKANIDANVKSKVDEKPIPKKTSEIKSEGVSKAKKEISKPALESKIKSKSATLNEKNKLLVAGKKVDMKDIKEKTKLIKSTTLTSVAKTSSEKTNSRITATISRAQKETVATSTKSAATVVNKLPKAPASKSVGLVGTKLPSSGNTVKNVVPTKVTSLTSRPKPPATVQGSKTLHPVGSSTLPKGQPSNQSNRVHATTAVRNVSSRPTTSVPSKVSVAAKPMHLSRPATTESKTKPLFTIKKTLTGTVKKADVKETKDTVNKQISASKNTTTGTLKTEATTRTISNRKIGVSATSRSTVNKMTIGPTSKKELLKKDVPKISSSKTAAKSALSTKLSKNIVKEELVPAVSQEVQKEIINVQEIERSAAEITPSSGEEKFILETNVKECQEKPSETIQICYENGTIDGIKTIENTNAVNDLVSENP